MTDYKYIFATKVGQNLAVLGLLAAPCAMAFSNPAAAQSSDVQVETIFSEDTSNQPSSAVPTRRSITESPSSPLFRGTTGASDGLFSGPVDPDTLDNPGTVTRSGGGGARVGLRRQDGEIRPGRRDNRRVTRSGRLVRPGDPGFETATAADDSNSAATVNPFGTANSALDSDLDPDLRETADDDLRIEDPLLTSVPLTGRTVGATALVRNQRNTSGGNTGFAVPRRQDFPTIDDERPYDPLGMRFGTFRVLSTLNATTIVTNNVTDSSSNPEADIGVELAPNVSISSDWNRHALSLDASGSAVFYNEFDSEDTTQFALTARGRLDLTLRTNIELDVGYALTTEQRGSADATTGAISEPDVTTWQAGATLNQRFNRLVTRTRVGYVEEINGDAELVGGGVDLGADEDFTQLDVSSRLTWEFSPSFAAFMEGAANRQSFDIAADADGILRDSHGYEVRIGATTEIGAATRAEVSIGYATLISEDARLADVDGLVIGADILWRPNALTSVNLTAETDLSTSSLGGALGSIEYQTALNIRHEFRRYAIGTLGLGWRHEDFSGSSTTENEFTFQMGGEYIFSRNIAALASYEYTNFNTSRLNSDFESNEFRIGLQLRR